MRATGWSKGQAHSTAPATDSATPPVTAINTSTDHGATWADPELEARLLKAYEVVSAHYRQDILLFWTRSSVFLLVQVGLLALVNAVFEKGTGTLGAFTIMGIGVSVIWFLVARSAAEWTEVWRVQTVELDDHVNPLKSYRVDSAPPARIRRTRLVAGRPAQIGQFLPVVFILGWVLLLITNFQSH